MKKTIVLCTTNRNIHEQTRQCLYALIRAGAGYMETNGCADVTLARNIALSAVYEATREPLVREKRDMLLMVDDDMIFDVATAQAVVDSARATGVAASAMYATTAATLAACRLTLVLADGDPGYEQLWMTGLGLIAIPLSRLEELAVRSPRFKFGAEKEYVAFTSSTCENGAWFSEDFTLCKELGGVHLLPVCAGHMKTIPLWPDETTVHRIRTGQRLDETDKLQTLPKIVDVLTDRAPVELAGGE
jgi:hypothetical protein